MASEHTSANLLDPLPGPSKLYRTTTATTAIFYDRPKQLIHGKQSGLSHTQNQDESADERHNLKMHEVQVEVHTQRCASNQKIEKSVTPDKGIAVAATISNSSFNITNHGLATKSDSNYQANLPENSLPYKGIHNICYDLLGINNTAETSAPITINDHTRASANSSFASAHDERNTLSALIFPDCGPSCSICDTSYFQSFNHQESIDVAIIRSADCSHSLEAENHIGRFFDRLMTKDMQKLLVKLKSYNLDELQDFPVKIQVHLAKIQVVIISQRFLESVKVDSLKKSHQSFISSVLRTKNAIAVLLGVTSDDIMNIRAVWPNFTDWYSVNLSVSFKNDLNFCKKFTDQVIHVFNTQLNASNSFTLFPKKVTRGQPRIAITFKKPILQNDELCIQLKARNQQIVLRENKLENPYTILLRIPDTLTRDREAIIEVSVFINKKKIGSSRIKSELNLGRWDMFDYIDRMGKVVPSFTEWFDTHISGTLATHYKNATDQNTDPSLEIMNEIIVNKADTFPTILHFAAYYGLYKTASVVLEKSDGLECNKKNIFEETPSDIAFTRQNLKLVRLLGDQQTIFNHRQASRFFKESDPSNAASSTDDENEILCHGSLNETHESNHTSVTNEQLLTLQQQKRQPSQKRPPSSIESAQCTKIVTLAHNLEQSLENVPRRRRLDSGPKKDNRRTSMLGYDIPRTKDQDYRIPPFVSRPFFNFNEDSYLPRGFTPTQLEDRDSIGSHLNNFKHKEHKKITETRYFGKPRKKFALSEPSIPEEEEAFPSREISSQLSNLELNFRSQPNYQLLKKNKPTLVGNFPQTVQQPEKTFRSTPFLRRLRSTFIRNKKMTTQPVPAVHVVPNSSSHLSDEMQSLNTSNTGLIAPQSTLQ